MDLRTSQLKNAIAELLKENGVDGVVLDKVNARGELVIAVVFREICPSCGGTGRRSRSLETKDSPLPAVEPPSTWSTQCSRCLTSSPMYPSQDEGDRELRALDWELRDDGQRWCLECSRTAREVQFRPTQRGVRRRRRQ